MRLFLSIFAVIISPLSPFSVPFADAAPNSSYYESEEAQIPKLPSAPPPLPRQNPRSIPHCERYYMLDGKKLECDSNVGKDAERLRPLFQDIPKALTELDTYQANQQKMRYAAYLGTLGFIAVIAGVLINHPPFDAVSGAPKPGAYVMFGGMGLAVNSMIYGLSVAKTNEAHLANAVQYYNAAHPERRIELQFSTKVNF